MKTKNTNIKNKSSKETKNKISEKRTKTKEAILQIKDSKLESITIKTKNTKSAKSSNFKVGSYIIYPSHGVGKIKEIQSETILDQKFSYYLIYFENEKLTIKVPIKSSAKVGLRSLTTKEEIEEVFLTLRSGVKKLKGMWSRRAQEYETKINSGDIMLLAEVIRDLTRDIDDSDRSYSERIIYETAIYRLSSEYAAIYGVELKEAKDHILTIAKDKLNAEDDHSDKDDFAFAFDDKGKNDDEYD